MRLGLAQINSTVGDLAGNSRKILDAYRQLVAQGAELVIFPELIICGYPPRDLLFKRHFVPDLEATVQALAKEIGDAPALIGTVERNVGKGRPFFNTAVFCRRGKVETRTHKCLLPTYDVFDEDRYFEPAEHPGLVEFQGLRIGVTICEDIWTHPMISTGRLYHGLHPLKQLAQEKCDLMVNLSASPWHYQKSTVRQTLVTDAAIQLGCPVAYVNAVGGNDELIFDGRSLASDASGQLLCGLAAFAEDCQVIEVPVQGQGGARPPGTLSGAAATISQLSNRSEGTVSGITGTHGAQIAPSFVQADMADIFAALTLGLKDYAGKSGFTKGLIALSGGIDSAVVAVIAAAAFGPQNLTGVSLPSAISSQHSRDDARILAERLGIKFETIPIAAVVQASETTLAPSFAGRKPDVAEENIQARVRGVLMMALSNKFGALLLTTGNKSEVAVGYCTLYGDMCGGLAVISDVFKTQVYSLARWMNAEAERQGQLPPIPLSTLEKPPSAELRPDQTDQDTLPPYDQLDAILAGYVEEGLSRQDLVDRGFAAGVVNDIVRKVDLNEYKRKQAAPGLKITPLAFGVGRRIPIVQKYVN
jgi:NAD+ synthase (glutamine-hydrolysing)